MNWLDEMENRDPAYRSYPELTGPEPCCAGYGTFADRVVHGCGAMHEYCLGCGTPLDSCPQQPRTSVA